ncbi:hypothetical protein E2C01_035807 [Portunus trituberculatus]|uniref:Uncharacterized protein n=1 Tax=Portunus trituberculatus TaxID=210409 RepID=A0A5B7F6X5_PORTR|nr:hypothetical protein [Portunus trituberculatus]
MCHSERLRLRKSVSPFSVALRVDERRLYPPFGVEAADLTSPHLPVPRLFLPLVHEEDSPTRE